MKQTNQACTRAVAAVFVIVLAVMLCLNVPIVLEHFASSQAPTLDGKLTEGLNALGTDAYGKEALTEVYGAAHEAMRLNVIGNFEFIRDSRGVMQGMGEPLDGIPFAWSVIGLKQVLDRTDTPLVFMQMPEKGRHFAFSDLYYFGKTLTPMLDTMRENGVDILDLESVYAQSNPELLDNFFFQTDVHFPSRTGLGNAAAVTDYLSERYGLTFPLTETVYDLDNWDWTPHDFCGNLSKSSGRLFSGVDTFETFYPRFDGLYRVTLPVTDEVLEGDFTAVMTNQYESENTEGLYWVTNYGRWPHPIYRYDNLSVTDGPDLLVLSDSTALTSNTFLAMNARSLTVADIRYFDRMPYLAENLREYSYDAVIVCASSYVFLGETFISEYSPTELPEVPETGLRLNRGYYGMSTETCGGRRMEVYDEIRIDLAETYVTLEGWAVDFAASQPLSALYVQVGDITLACPYGITRAEIAAYLELPGQPDIGFHVSFPTTYITEQDVSEILFYQISADGTYRYPPVSFRVTKE